MTAFYNLALVICTMGFFCKLTAPFVNICVIQCPGTMYMS